MSESWCLKQPGGGAQLPRLSQGGSGSLPPGPRRWVMHRDAHLGGLCFSFRKKGEHMASSFKHSRRTRQAKGKTTLCSFAKWKNNAKNKDFLQLPHDVSNYFDLVTQAGR